jgi:hypothetical protein
MRITSELPYLSALACIFIILLGGMMMPLLAAMARSCLPLAAHVTRVVAWAARKLKLVRRFILATATAGAALSLLIAVIAAPANAQTPREAAQKATTQAIERMIGILDKAAKHPVVKGAKVIARGYTAVKVYRLSKEVKGLKTDVAALQASVHAVLTEVTAVIARIEVGEELTAAELDAINARIDVHAVQIAAAEAEIEVLKLRMDEAERKQRDQDRRQQEQDRRQRDVERKQQDQAQRQRDTDARVTAQQQRIGRDSKTPNLFYDPTCKCRRDARDKAGGSVTAAAGN